MTEFGLEDRITIGSTGSRERRAPGEPYVMFRNQTAQDIA